MITYKDIKVAVNQKLATLGIEINSRDVSEGFERPSFFVQLENSTRSGDADQVHITLTVQIYYFPSDRYGSSVEVLEMQETLEGLFDLKLPVNDRLLSIDDFNSTITDGVLNCSFDLDFYDGRERNVYDQYPSEPMDGLELEIKVKE